MRPIIDLNNLSYSKETKIYFTRMNILLRIVIMTALMGVSIYYFVDNKFWVALLTAGIFLFQIPYLTESIKRINEIQFRINAKGIQYQDDMLESWDNIENERVESVYTDEGSDHYFVYFIKDSGQVMKFDIASLSIDSSELKHCLYIQRGRFENEKAGKI
ncbi:hypothetical protein [Flavobacterium chungangense]|nr:hypothetical protein [Flavobacterium chungangense]